MLSLDQLYSQKISGKMNSQINHFFNQLIKNNRVLGQLMAFFVIFAKCALHTLAILANTCEYCVRGFFSLFSTSGSVKEYFSTLGSFLVINSINALTIIPDLFIRTYFALKESKIDPSQTQHTLYYKVMGLIG